MVAHGCTNASRNSQVATLLNILNALDVPQKKSEQIKSVTRQIIKIASRCYFAIRSPIVFPAQIYVADQMQRVAQGWGPERYP